MKKVSFGFFVFVSVLVGWASCFSAGLITTNIAAVADHDFMPELFAGKINWTGVDLVLGFSLLGAALGGFLGHLGYLAKDLSKFLKFSASVGAGIGMLFSVVAAPFVFPIKGTGHVASAFGLLVMFAILFWWISDGIEGLAKNWDARNGGSSIDSEDERAVINCNGNGGF